LLGIKRKKLARDTLESVSVLILASVTVSEFMSRNLLNLRPIEPPIFLGNGCCVFPAGRSDEVVANRRC
jgi:hypothetical protein